MSKKQGFLWVLLGIFAVVAFFATLFVTTRSQQVMTPPPTALILKEDSSQEPQNAPDIIGGYQSQVLPSASSPGRVYALTLEKNQLAVFATDYQNGEPPILEKGAWQLINNSSLLVTLTEKNGKPLSEESELSFSVTKDLLTLTNYDLSTWGSEGLSLAKQKQGTITPSKNPLVETSWEWVRTTLNDDTVITPEKSDTFVLTFLDTTRFGSTTDCNRVMGSYSLNDTSLTFSQMLSTKMACVGDSKEEAYTNNLSEVASYFIQGDILTLELKMDTGSMQFTQQADPTTSQKNQPTTTEQVNSEEPTLFLP